MVACPNALAASTACRVTGRWFTPHVSVHGPLRFLAPVLRSLSDPLAGLILLIDLLHLSLRLCKIFGMSTGRSLE